MQSNTLNLGTMQHPFPQERMSEALKREDRFYEFHATPGSRRMYLIGQKLRRMWSFIRPAQVQKSDCHAAPDKSEAMG